MTSFTPLRGYPVHYQRLHLKVEDFVYDQPRVPMDRPELVAAFCRDMIQLCQEVMIWIGLDTSKRLVAIDEIFKGTVDACIAHPRDVFRNALVMAPTVHSIILVHNHPAGNPEPSRQDHEFFERVAAAGELLQIPVIDCLVVAEYGYWSQQGGLAQLPASYTSQDVLAPTAAVPMGVCSDDH